MSPWAALETVLSSYLIRSSFINGVSLPLRLGHPLGPQRAHHLARLPHLARGDLLQLLLQLFAIILAAVRVEHSFRLLAGFDALVQLLESRLGRVAERLEPVEGAALRRRRAVG